MQQLERRNTYTPMDVSQVHSNCDLPLNREETLSVADLKTPSNNSDGNPHSLKIPSSIPDQGIRNFQTGTSGQDLRVPVINMRGEPLMPTTPG